MENIRSRLARNLRKLRREKGLSQEALALQAGINRTYIGDIECLRRNPTVTIIDRLAGALEVTAGELLD